MEKYDDSEVLELIKNYRLNGYSYAKISKEIGISVWEIEKILKKYNVSPLIRKKCNVCGSYFYTDWGLQESCSDECKKMRTSLQRGVRTIWKNLL